MTKPTTTRDIHKSIAIILLQYNGSAQTIRCLESVKELNYKNFFILVVDNASTPDEINNIQKYIGGQDETGRTKLIKNLENLGYSGGNNVGIKQAKADGADYVLILNPDTTVMPNLLTKLVETGESDEQTGLLAPAIDENNHITYGGKIEWLKPELKHLVTYPDFAGRNRRSMASDSDDVTRMDYLPGACLLIKRQVIEKIGLLDENYFLYFEDADYSLRARQAGFELKLVAEPLVHHQVSSSTRTLGSPLLLRYHFRNALYFNWLHAPLEFKVLLPLWVFWIILKQFGKWLLQPSKRTVAKAILAGVLDFHLDQLGKIND